MACVQQKALEILKPFLSMVGIERICNNLETREYLGVLFTRNPALPIKKVWQCSCNSWVVSRLKLPTDIGVNSVQFGALLTRWHEAFSIAQCEWVDESSFYDQSCPIAHCSIGSLSSFPGLEDKNMIWSSSLMVDPSPDSFHRPLNLVYLYMPMKWHSHTKVLSTSFYQNVAQTHSSTIQTSWPIYSENHEWLSFSFDTHI